MNPKAFTLRKSIPIDQLEEYMQKWEQQAPGFVKVYSIGESGGYPILCAEFTDFAVPACEKETALITAQHSGMEITGMTSVLSLGNYLVALGPLARKILSCQTVLLVPCPNCFSYAKQDPEYQFRNEAGVCEYSAAFKESSLELEDPAKTPAAEALKKLVDLWKPEFILDAHGLWYDESIMAESTGAFSSCGLNRTYNRSFVDAVNSAAEAEGYPIMREDDIETLFPTSKICFEPEYRTRFRIGSETMMLLGPYAYIKYHTFFLNMEVAFERSGLLRLVKALELGCEGYPGRRIINPFCLTETILVGGKNAEERRASREELWTQKQFFGVGLLHPERGGLTGHVITLNAEAYDRVCGTSVRCSLDYFLDKMQNEGYDLAACREALEKEPYPANIQRSSSAGNGSGTVKITYGFITRFNLPYSDAQPTAVWFNGKQLAKEQYTVAHNGLMVCVDIPVYGENIRDVMFAAVQYSFTEKEKGIVEF